MGRFSFEDKIRIEALCEQGWGYKRIMSAYPLKQWKIDSVKSVCRQFKRTGSVATSKVGSGRPQSARCEKTCVTADVDILNMSSGRLCIKLVLFRTNKIFLKIIIKRVTS